MLKYYYIIGIYGVHMLASENIEYNLRCDFPNKDVDLIQELVEDFKNTWSWKKTIFFGLILFFVGIFFTIPIKLINERNRNKKFIKVIEDIEDIEDSEATEISKVNNITLFIMVALFDNKTFNEIIDILKLESDDEFDKAIKTMLLDNFKMTIEQIDLILNKFKEVHNCTSRLFIWEIEKELSKRQYEQESGSAEKAMQWLNSRTFIEIMKSLGCFNFSMRREINENKEVNVVFEFDYISSSGSERKSLDKLEFPAFVIQNFYQNNLDLNPRLFLPSEKLRNLMTAEINAKVMSFIEYQQSDPCVQWFNSNSLNDIMLALECELVSVGQSSETNQMMVRLNHYDERGEFRTEYLFFSSFALLIKEKFYAQNNLTENEIFCISPEIDKRLASCVKSLLDENLLPLSGAFSVSNWFKNQDLESIFRRLGITDCYFDDLVCYALLLMITEKILAALSILLDIQRN